MAFSGSDGSIGIGVSEAGSDCIVIPNTGTTLYGLIEAQGPYTPASGETITVELEAYRT